MNVERSRRIWSQGSYPDTATHFLPMAARLVEAVGVGPDDEVLDIGCGTGNVAVTAARRGATVTGLDVSPAMLDRARENAEIAGVEGIGWREGTATDLPFADDAFDATLSCLGHMYGDPPEAAAAELRRVTRPGGRIGFTSWTPTGCYPFVAGVALTYLSPSEHPDVTEPPFMWGDSDVVAGRLGDAVENLEFATDSLAYPALSPAHFWEETATNSGMVLEFLELVEETDRPALREEMIETIERYFDDGANAVELTYLRTTATVPRRG